MTFLKQTYLVQTNGKFDKKKYEMVLGKSFFPYEYCQSLEQMASVKELPERNILQVHSQKKIFQPLTTNLHKKFGKSFKCDNLIDYTKVILQNRYNLTG
jgi:hypothetical protein